MKNNNNNNYFIYNIIEVESTSLAPIISNLVDLKYKYLYIKARRFYFIKDIIYSIYIVPTLLELTSRFTSNKFKYL